jgi:anti-sigma factor ChrR (cupin superfamily)
MRIVDLIKTSKNIRQLIFATHNPNLVVNGDADKVIAMASLVSDGRPVENTPRVVIDVDGAIETPPVRVAITTVMEGGQKAFDLRGKKYRFEREGR